MTVSVRWFFAVRSTVTWIRRLPGWTSYRAVETTVRSGAAAAAVAPIEGTATGAATAASTHSPRAAAATRRETRRFIPGARAGVRRTGPGALPDGSPGRRRAGPCRRARSRRPTPPGAGRTRRAAVRSPGRAHRDRAARSGSSAVRTGRSSSATANLANGNSSFQRRQAPVRPPEPVGDGRRVVDPHDAGQGGVEDHGRPNVETAPSVEHDVPAGDPVPLVALGRADPQFGQPGLHEAWVRGGRGTVRRRHARQSSGRTRSNPRGAAGTWAGGAIARRPRAAFDSARRVPEPARA